MAAKWCRLELPAVCERVALARNTPQCEFIITALDKLSQSHGGNTDRKLHTPFAPECRCKMCDMRTGRLTSREQHEHMSLATASGSKDAKDAHTHTSACFCFCERGAPTKTERCSTEASG